MVLWCFDFVFVRQLEPFCFSGQNFILHKKWGRLVSQAAGCCPTWGVGAPALVVDRL